MHCSRLCRAAERPTDMQRAPVTNYNTTYNGSHCTKRYRLFTSISVENMLEGTKCLHHWISRCSLAFLRLDWTLAPCSHSHSVAYSVKKQFIHKNTKESIASAVNVPESLPLSQKYPRGTFLFSVSDRIVTTCVGHAVRTNCTSSSRPNPFTQPWKITLPVSYEYSEMCIVTLQTSGIHTIVFITRGIPCVYKNWR